MKKTILNLGAILLAFAIGVSINNACADSIDNMNDSELRKLVAELQQEVNDLKERVAALERNNDTGGEFVVDGMHFGRDGNCTDPVDYYGYSSSDDYEIIDGVRVSPNSHDASYHYTYDSYGRIESFWNDKTERFEKTTYSYSNKTITMEFVAKYKDKTTGQFVTSGLMELGSITTYHYK
jgi:hypothetical protein